jgi:hypothetical protein
MRKSFPIAGNFLNIDVELISRRRLGALAEELKKCILHDGRIGARWLLTFETDSIQGVSKPDGVIRKLCKLIHNLSPAAKREWKSAQSRAFDIGFESAPLTERETVVVRSRISTESLRSIADLNATLDITCYRHFEDAAAIKKKNKPLNASRKNLPPR